MLSLRTNHDSCVQMALHGFYNHCFAMPIFEDRLFIQARDYDSRMQV